MKRIIAVFCCVLMIFGSVTAAFADDGVNEAVSAGITGSEGTDRTGIESDVPGTEAAADENSDDGSTEVIAGGELGDCVTWTLYKGGLLEISEVSEEEEFSCYLSRSHTGYKELEKYKDQITEAVICGRIEELFGEDYFEAWTALKTITIPGSVVSLDRGAFTGCSSLESVYYGGMQEDWYGMVTVENIAALPQNCLLYINGQEAVPAIPPLTLPAAGKAGDRASWSLDESGCLTISGAGELYDGMCSRDQYGNTYMDNPGLWHVYNKYITRVVVEDGITGLSVDQFNGCSAIQTIELPDSVTFIDEYAFPYKSSLETVYYAGTKEKWESIFSGSDAFPPCVTVVCSDGEITTHTPAEAVRENETEENYDEVIYCSACGKELSRTTVAKEAEEYEITSAELSVTTLVYNGKARTPSVTVTADVEGEERTLTKGTDYTVSYKNNTNAGTAVVTVTGQGVYTGTVIKNFEIKPASIAKSTVESKSGLTSFNYKGRELKPAVVVTSSVTGKVLKNGRDYTLSYVNNINAGTGAVIITGTGNYRSKTKLTFTIKPVTIAKSTVESKSGLTSFTYKGRELKPAVVVTSSVTGKVLKNGRDYTLSYVKNINAGTGAVVVSGIGNYKGKAKLLFTIDPASISKSTVTIKNGRTSFTYKAEPIKPAVVVTGSVTGKVLKKDTDYTVSYRNNKNAGTATITITGTGNYRGTLKTTFTIRPKALSEDMFFPVSAEYTGKPVEPDMMTNTAWWVCELKKDVDYTVTYRNNIKTYSRYMSPYLKNPPEPAYAVIKGTGNYKGTVKRTFDIYAGFFGYAAGHTDPGVASQMYAEVGDSFQLQLKWTDGRITSSKGGTWKVEETTLEGYDTSIISLTESGQLTALKKGTTCISYTRGGNEVTWVTIWVN